MPISCIVRDPLFLAFDTDLEVINLLSRSGSVPAKWTEAMTHLGMKDHELHALAKDHLEYHAVIEGLWVAAGAPADKVKSWDNCLEHRHFKRWTGDESQVMGLFVAKLISKQDVIAFLT